MLKNNDIKLLDKFFLSNYFSYLNLKNIKLNNTDAEIKKIYSNTLDTLYDGMDTVLEVLDMCGADI